MSLWRWQKCQGDRKKNSAKVRKGKRNGKAEREVDLAT
jgi:hypothetical protein